MSAVELDPELKDWVLEFIRGKERVTVEDVRREFFPGEIGAPYLYLDRLVAEGAVKLKVRSQTYEWAHRAKDRPKSDPVPKPKRVRITHGDCDHRNTPWAKEKCRRAQDPNRNPADFREKRLRARWAQFMDNKVHELTAGQIQELTGESTTPAQFERRIRVHAYNYGLKCSAKSTENGIRFIMGRPLNRSVRL
ncbi:hypothetical protein [Streptomyces turgidiscabies]|uniref:hypothetical protein n=1 Tax=Streptomyces turgidiscabies TaxID=85558 RepID=UPI0038F8183F